MLLGTGKRADERFYYLQGPKVMAHRDGSWKLILPGPQPLRGEGIGEQPALFNLATDLGEQHNVAAEHPEIVARLRQQLDDFAQGLANEPTP